VNKEGEVVKNVQCYAGVVLIVELWLAPGEELEMGMIYQ